MLTELPMLVKPVSPDAAITTTPQLAELLGRSLDEAWPAIAGAKSMLGIVPVCRDAADFPVFEASDADRIHRFVQGDPSSIVLRDPGPPPDETGLDQPLA